MIIKRNGAAVLSLNTSGDVCFAPFHRDEGIVAPAGPGELQVRGPGDEPLLASFTVPSDPFVDTVTDITLRGRLCTQAAMPLASGLQVRAPSAGCVAALSSLGDLLVKGTDRSALPNPAGLGKFTPAAHVYAAPNLAYPKGLLPAYGDFNKFNIADWSTRSVNLSAAYDSVGAPNSGAADCAWPFAIDNVPINGLVRVPSGQGPFPLIVFAHGNHTPLENSTPGYLYLCNTLASQGVISATIDVNFLNGTMSGENAARALVQLEHVRQFRIWNAQSGHPLKGKVDLSRIVIAGHSRGGEAIAHASLFNGMTSFVPQPSRPAVALNGTGLQPLGPYQFALRGLIAIAPTDNQYRPVAPLLPLSRIATVVNGVSYLLVHGTKDADVTRFPGYQAYDRALPYDPSKMTEPASGYKVLHWIYGANHNYFNTAWGADRNQDTSDVLDADVQRSLAQAVFGAWAQIHLYGRSSYWDFLRKPRTAQSRGWLGQPVGVVSQYHDPRRRWIQTFDESGDLQITAPATGAVDTSSIQAELQFLAFPRPAAPSGFDDTRFLFQQTGGLVIRWKTSGESYRLHGLDFGGDVDGLQVLSLRTGQSTESENTADTNQDFHIEVTDRNARLCSVLASDYAPLPYPDKYALQIQPPQRISTCERKMVMQTIRIPLSVLCAAGLDVRRIDTLTLRFDVTSSGVLYVDDIQLTL